MPNIKELLKDYLTEVNLIQLATSVDDKPWACTVHFYSDDELNFYWVSSYKSNHSQYIAANPNVSAAIMIHENTADEDYVIGVSLVGTAERLEGLPDDAIWQGYMSKLLKDPALPDEIRAGQSPSRFYKLTPSKIVLLDKKTFTDNPRKEIDLHA